MSPLGNKKIILYLKNRSGSTIFQQHKRATRLLSKIQVGGIRGQIFRTLENNFAMVKKCGFWSTLLPRLNKKPP